MVETTAASPPPARPRPRPALEWPHSYAIALWLFRLFAIFLGIWSGQSLAQLSPELSLVLRAVPATAQTAAGAIAYLEGTPLLDRSRRPSDNLRILEHLESFFPGRPLLYAHLTLEHTVGSGEDAETVIDDALTFFQPFTITQDAQNWFIAAPPQEWRSLRFAAQDITPFLKEASPNSTDLTLSAMAPDLVTVLGHVARASDGRPTLVARYPRISSPPARR